MMRLRTVEDVLAARVDQLRTTHRIPGVVATAFTGERVIGTVTSGWRSAEDRTPITADTLFRLHSVTKMITAAAVLRLRDRGELELDTTLPKVAPRLADAAPELLSDVTIAQLLSHTSGLSDGSTQIFESGRDPADLVQQIRNLAATVTAVAPPGRIYSYSNYGYSILGAVLEELTGKPYTQAVRELVARPLGLASLCFDPVTAMTYPLSQQHSVVRERAEVDHWYGDSVRMYPAAMAFLSPRDLTQLGRMYLCGGLVPDSARRFLSERSLADQRRRVADIGLAEDRHYGLGLYVGPRAGDADCIGHEGYYTGMWCAVMIYPGQNRGVVWCDNRGDSPELSDARRAAIAAISQELGVPECQQDRPLSPEVPDEAAFSGHYRRHAARPLEVSRGLGGLRLRLAGQDFPLTHHTGNIYRIEVPPGMRAKSPLTPHAGSSTPSVAFHAQAGTRAVPGASQSQLSINGLVYERVS